MGAEIREHREERLRVIEQSMVEGMSPSAIVDAASKRYSVHPRIIWSDMKEIENRWQQQGTLIANRSLGNLRLALLRREFLFYKSLRENNLGAALGAERDRCELLGLYERAGGDAKDSDSGLSVSEVRARLADLLKPATPPAPPETDDEPSN